MPQIHLYVTPNGLAKRAGVSRGVVLRLLAIGEIEPDAQIEFGDTIQPIFTEHRAVDVLRASRPPKQLRVTVGT